MPDEIDERPYRDAIVAAVEAWLDTLTGTSGVGINRAMQLTLQRGRELRAARLANALGREPRAEVTHARG
jgi:hypothetical protein